MSINNNSYSTVSNISFGSNEMKNLWWNAQTFQLPAITTTGIKINTRAGAMIGLASDTVEYDDLSIDLILDKEWKVYDELYAHFLKRLNVETGEFLKFDQFDLWVELFNGEGHSVKKFWFYNCRLQSFGDMLFNTQTSEDELNVLNMTFSFDYLEYDNTFLKARIAAQN